MGKKKTDLDFNGDYRSVFDNNFTAPELSDLIHEKNQEKTKLVLLPDFNSDMTLGTSVVSTYDLGDDKALTAEDRMNQFRDNVYRLESDLSLDDKNKLVSAFERLQASINDIKVTEFKVSIDVWSVASLLKGDSFLFPLTGADYVNLLITDRTETESIVRLKGVNNQNQSDDHFTLTVFKSESPKISGQFIESDTYYSINSIDEYSVLVRKMVDHNI